MLKDKEKEKQQEEDEKRDNRKMHESVERSVQEQRDHGEGVVIKKILLSTVQMNFCFFCKH